MLGGLCPWPVTWCVDLDGINPAVTGTAVEVATEILWEATARQFGTCPVTIRPCRKACGVPYGDRLTWYNGSSWGYPFPMLYNGLWYNIGCKCTGDCGCSAVSEIMLPEQLVSVDEVVIGGEVLPATGYEIYDAQRLVRTDGGEWPLCQDWGAPTGSPGTWTVTATYGRPVKALGSMAVGVLAAEIARMCSGNDCDLPTRAVSVVNQGVSVSMLDLESFLENGLTGLTIPDQFIMLNNKLHMQDRAHVIPMDTPSARVVWPG